jgi:hypothetical protein
MILVHDTSRCEHILPPSQGLRPMFFSKSQTMLSLTKFL